MLVQVLKTMSKESMQKARRMKKTVSLLKKKKTKKTMTKWIQIRMTKEMEINK